MTTIFYPDVSEFQSGESLHGCVAACARASEGDWLADPQYAGYKRQAENLRIPLLAYHFLESLSSPTAQAKFCYSIVGSKIPLMLDFESYASSSSRKASSSHQGFTAGSSREIHLPGFKKRLRGLLGGSYPSLATATQFIDAYRQLGGTCFILYLPWWYWTQLGSPSLQPFISRGMILVSSDYTEYSDTGPGWRSYGGMKPLIWQYTSTGPGSSPTDWNAFQGDGSGSIAETVKQLQSVWRTGRTTPPPPPPPPVASSNVASMNGDDMFFLPTGNGAQVAVDVPVAVPQADGTFKPPTRLVMNAHGISTVSVLWSNSAGNWVDQALDWNRDPTFVPIPPGAQAVKFRRQVGHTDPVQVTCSWR